MAGPGPNARVPTLSHVGRSLDFITASGSWAGDDSSPVSNVGGEAERAENDPLGLSDRAKVPRQWLMVRRRRCWQRRVSKILRQFLLASRGDSAGSPSVRSFFGRRVPSSPIKTAIVAIFPFCLK
jgi:hypothetical protein